MCVSLTTAMLDATYKTTKYNLALFFCVCVCTNARYSVVAEFVTQSETANQICSALETFKQIEPQMSPGFLYDKLL